MRNKKKSIEIQYSFKGTIRSIMIQHGYKGTIRELATVLGISEPSVVNKLSGKEDFKIKEIRRFAQTFSLTNDEICEIFIRR